MSAETILPTKGEAIAYALAQGATVMIHQDRGPGFTHFDRADCPCGVTIVSEEQHA